MCTVKERAENYGVRALTDNELFQLVIGGDKSYNDSGFQVRSLPELIASGYTRTEAVKLLSIYEISQRLWKQTCSTDKIFKTPEETARHYGVEMRDYEKEHVKVLFLNSRYRLIAEKDITIGISNCSLVSTRETLIEAFRHGAKSITLLHNHPSQSSSPSEQDIDVTEKMAAGCSAVGIGFNDHIIIAGEGEYYSFREKGLI